MAKIVSTNPGKGYEEIDSVNVSTEGEIIEIVRKAHDAQKSWRNISLDERIKCFTKLLNVYKKRNKEVAELQSKEMGKPISESLEDVAFDLDNIKSKIELAKKHLSPVVLDETKEQQNVLYYEPYGVAAVIVPWNYPSSNLFIACTQLLLAGNVVIFKHSEETPLTALLISEIINEAGFPEGVFNIIHGDGKVGDFLTSQDINIIHFTGSTKVGHYLYKKAADKFIPAILEMGGSSPGVIFNDANLEESCSNACIERFANCGQVCCALKRLIVHKDVFDDVVAMMKKKVESMKIGDPLDPNTQVGPLVSKKQLDLLVEQVEDAKEKGATIVTGGNIIDNMYGAYFQPTIITNVTKDMRVVTEEVFGPVLPVLSFMTDEEAVEIANNTIYGLSAYVYGKDIDKMRKVALQIDAGQLSINGASYFSDNSPFGGYKMSGLGRNDGAMGFYEVTQKKVVAEPV